MRALFLKVLGVLAAFSFSVALISNYGLCGFFLYQPKIPDSVRQLRKVKFRVE